MNITIAVGLITAGSTLAGGLIASVTSLKVQGKQLREQNVLLKAERQERQDAERRSIRRDAYTGFLNQLDKVDYLIDVWWPGTASFKYELVKSEGDISDITSALMALENLANIVSLEGPKGPELAAKTAAMIFSRSFVTLVVEREKAKEGTSTITYALDKDKLDKSTRARREAKEAFIEAASKALE
jgi:hypothetical protein